jgi:hypothetical protein
MQIWCCGCQTNVEAVRATGRDIYPHRADLHKKRFWRCQACGNYVGCHPGSEKPLGNIPTPELRKARSHVHAILDPIWKTNRMPRGQIYALISQKIGRQYHTGEIKTVEDARTIYRIVKDISASLEAT